MYLKENHAHVGSDGMVYLPYTHEWNPRTHSLIEMVVAMSSVFSADPPVFTRSTPAPPPPPADAPAPPPAYSADIVSAATTSADSERFIQQQAEAILAREAEEANRVAEAARRAAKEDEEKERQLAAQKEWELQKRLQVREKVNKKINSHLSEMSQQTKASVQDDYRSKQKLETSKDQIEKELEFLSSTKQQLERHIATVNSRAIDIRQWLEESQKGSQNGSEDQKEVAVDGLCQPASNLHAQMLDLAAENAALTDALYFLDRGLFMGQMDCNDHLKSVRKLAKRQFLVRAHLIKINQALRSSF